MFFFWPPFYHGFFFVLPAVLLGGASQRVEYLAIEWFGPDWAQDILAEWKRKERGSLPGMFECLVILYIISKRTGRGW